MSFLKSEKLTLGSVSVLLYELSALQRADYFEYLASLEAGMPEDLSDMQRMALVVKRNVQVNSWLVSRSLWHSATDREENEMHQEVMRTWSSEALNIAVEKVLNLSGMVPKEVEDKAVAGKSDSTEQHDGKDGVRPLAK
jgi:phage minor tail protein G